MVNWKLLRYHLACFKKVYGNRVWRGENCLRTQTKLRHRPWVWNRRQVLPGPCRERGQELSPRGTCLEAWRTALPRKGVAERQTGNLLSISIEHDEHGLWSRLSGFQSVWEFIALSKTTHLWMCWDFSYIKYKIKTQKVFLIKYIAERDDPSLLGWSRQQLKCFIIKIKRMIKANDFHIMVIIFVLLSTVLPKPICESGIWVELLWVLLATEGGECFCMWKVWWSLTHGRVSVMTVVSLTRTTRETKEVLYHSNGIPLSIKKVHKNYLVLTIANLFS